MRRIIVPCLLIIIFIFGACKPAGNLNFSENMRIIRNTSPNIDTNHLISEYIVSQDIEDSISLDSLSVNQRKKQFLNIMLPAVLAVKARLDFKRERVLVLEKKKELSPLDKKFVDQLEKEYKTRDLTVLAKRLQTFPVSIVLAQAALESGWGTSRFFQEANNPFGMWSFNTSHARVQAKSHRDGKKIYLRKFNNLQTAVKAYYAMLATGRTYQNFRNLKMKTDQPLKLIQGLNMYSERGEDYVHDLANVIVFNNLQKYDHYEIGPQYLAEEIRQKHTN